jgi:hypothetical protein
MREIDLYASQDLAVLPVDTFVLYGDTGSGKTTASGGFPRPLVLADETEGGWKSLVGMTDEQLFEPDVDPMVWGIAEMADMATALKRIPPLIASGRIRTVVISSITFYANTYLAHLIRNDPGRDSRQVYGELAVHLREIRTRMHSLGVNVVWEALADHPESGEDGKAIRPGRPSIPGKSADQFSAGVGYLFRAVLDDVRKDGKIVDRVLKLMTQTTGNYLARPRIGAAERQLPNPLLGGYKGFLEARGYDVAQLRKALPPIQRATSTPAAKPQTTSAPKVVTPPSGAKATSTK